MTQLPFLPIAKAEVPRHPAAHGQSPWSDRRRDRDRQNRNPPGSRRALQPHRRTGLYGRRQRRPVRTGQGRRGPPKVMERVATLGLEDFQPQGFPVVFWDLFGEQGHPVRTTVSEMGPLLLARLLDLNPTQAGILTLVFKVADDQGMLLLDLKDLQAMVRYVGDNAKDFRTAYGNISTASIGTIQRALLTLEQQGAETSSANRP